MIGFETNRLTLAFAGVLSYSIQRKHKKSLAHSLGFFSSINRNKIY